MSYQNSRRYSTSPEMQLAGAQVNLGNGSAPDQLAYQKWLLDYQSRGLSSGGWYTGPLPYRFKVMDKTTVFAEPAQSQAMGELYAGPEWFYGTDMVPDPSQPGDTQFIQLLDGNWVEFGGNLQAWKNNNGNGVTCPPGYHLNSARECVAYHKTEDSGSAPPPDPKCGPGYYLGPEGKCVRKDVTCPAGEMPDKYGDCRRVEPITNGMDKGKDKGTGKGEGTEKPSAIPPELFLAAGAFLVLQGLLGGN